VSISPPHPGAGRAGRLCMLVLLWLAHPATASALGQGSSPVVEVPFQGSRAVSVPGIGQVLVIEESICRAELAIDGIRFFGLRRGESVVFAWIGEVRVDLLVRVVLPPPVLVRRSLSQDQVQRLGQGEMSTTAQVAINPLGDQTYHFQHHFNWSQQADGRKFGVRSQAHHTTAPDVPLNVDTLSLQYGTRSVALTFVDFGLSLNGGTQARVTSYSPTSSHVFRGVDAALTRGPNQVEVFAGTSLPSYYRSFSGTSRIAGVNVNRRQSANLYLYSTTAGISVPQSGTSEQGSARTDSVFHTSGFAYQMNDRWAAQLTGGAGNRGVYGDGTLAFNGIRLSAWVAAASSSPDFPLNQLQLLSGGGTSARAATTWKAASRVAASLFYQHSSTRPTLLFPSFAGVSDYVNPNVNLILSRAQSLTLNGVQSRSRGGLALGGQTLTRSLDLGWTSLWMGRLVNSAQVSASKSEDPQQIDTGLRLSFRNALSLRLKGGHLNVGFQRNQHDPSLATRLRQQIGLLPGNLQELFLADPAGFVQSSSLPPEVRELLDSLRSADSQVSVSGQFRIGSRLNMSTSYSLLQNSQTSGQRTRTHAFGYVLAYQLTPTLQIGSSLSDNYFLDARQTDLVRTMTFLLGLSKTFRGAPAWLAPSTRQYKVEGRVFIDRNVTGTYDTGEAGLSGIVVHFDDGRKAVTDAAGRFQFAGLKAGAYRVSLPLGQFRDPVRATTMTSVPVELYERRQASVDFGIVNFARVMGSIYNDYAHDGERRADSPGLQKVTVIVTGADGAERRVVTDGSGEYRIDDLRPGLYRLGVDSGTIPLNYMGPAGPVTFEVKPTRTVVVDVPMRALRSVVGHVYLSVPMTTDSEGERKLVPAAGVTVIAGQSQSTTDSTGRFTLRDLAAGDLVVTLRPAKPLPPGMRAPAGTLHLSKEAIQIEDAVIVIRNRELLRYLQAN
jgi:SdrD B-like protein